ncbi:hypothetical protein BFP72_15010 [Reichenbachiella sp. 5M10]|uniref:hypothetical protein n=1 Tax=Reichenbachiella sp. 5M10 TaxID=1889772 RepID=UPI000C15A8DA|nr:hypothetical protein [Reichenbachiella sp. 5M10]PIB36617.1 hypothetical protein BFP72_15010 [Reichenbachiella sp. 5M10]
MITHRFHPLPEIIGTTWAHLSAWIPHKAKSRHFIWYNPTTATYREGSAEEYKSLQASCDTPQSLPLLMEFATSEKALAQQIARELNTAMKEPYILKAIA